MNKRLLVAAAAAVVILVTSGFPASGQKAEGPRLACEVRPSILFVQEQGVLKQRIDLIVDNPGDPLPGRLEVVLPTKKLLIPLPRIAAGSSTIPIYLAEILKPAKAEFILKTEKETVTRKIVLTPQRKWTVFLFPHSHTDIGYTDLQTRVAKNHCEYLDSVIDFCRATDAYPDEAKFRWNIEVSWALQNYVKSRPEAKVRELVSLIKAGRIELSALYLNLSDCYAHEELIRSVLYSSEFSRTNGFPLRAAMNNDVNGYGWALPQIFSQIGVRYFTTGINETRSRAPLRRPNPFYWESLDGSRILHWNGEHYLFANYELLLHEGLEKSVPKVADYLAKLETRGDFPYDLIAFHISGYVTDNCPPKKELSDRVREWNNRWAYPKLRLATMTEFFEAMEKRYGKDIPVHKLGWPDYWTDGVASTAFETGVNRLAHNELLSAEKWAVAVKKTSKDFKFPAAEIAEAYDNMMLYDEHTWGGWNSIDDPDSEFARGQWAVKSAFAYNAREIAKIVLNRGLLALAKNIPSSDGFSLAVFNPLSWERSDVVKIALPEELAGKNGRFKLVEKKTGAEISFQLPDKNAMMFQARNIPSLGYAVYRIIPDVAPSPPAPAATVGENRIENRFFAVTADSVSGGLSSIIDKEAGMELVDAKAGFKANQYIYENPEGGRKAVDNMEQRAKFNRVSPAAAAGAPGMRGPVASSLVIRSKAKPCPEIRQEIILYDGIKRIDIVNTLKKNEVYEPEALYFAFPFLVEGGRFTFEIADSMMNPETGQLPGTTRDWLTVQHWVEIANPARSIVWAPMEAPLVQFGDINTGKWLKKLEITNAALYSYAMNNYWMTNFKAAQGGTIVFRYSITSRNGGADPVASSRFGWDVHTPLAAAWIPANNKGTLAAAEMSFFNVDKPNVIIQAVKESIDGFGIALRLREIAGIETTVQITSPLIKAELVTYQATDIGEGPANAETVVPRSIFVTLKPFAIQTVVIRD